MWNNKLPARAMLGGVAGQLFCGGIDRHIILFFKKVLDKPAIFVI